MNSRLSRLLIPLIPMQVQVVSPFDHHNCSALIVYTAPPASEEELEEESVPGFMNTQSMSPSKQYVRPPPKIPSEKKAKKVRALAFDDTSLSLHCFICGTKLK